MTKEVSAGAAVPVGEGPPAPGEEPLARIQVQLQAAEAAVAAARDQQLRAAAELENIRRRTAREIENAQRYALEKFAGELLAVRDSLELAVRDGSSADAAVLRAGQQATLHLLVQAFEKFAIKAIAPAGQPFDPAVHEAMLSQPSGEVPPGAVLQVLQTGYQLNGRLLRPARVIVAAAPVDSTGSGTASGA